jgi:hypothetical protein
MYHAACVFVETAYHAQDCGVATRSVSFLTEIDLDARPDVARLSRGLASTDWWITTQKTL